MQYRGLTLDRFQRQAVEAIEDGRSVIVSAPTGTGKTLIADYLIDLMLEEGSEVIYTSPIKALSNQKYRQYVKLFGEDKIGLITGDLVINRDAPIKIMTTEILRNILLEGDHSPLPDEAFLSPSDVQLPELSNLGAVIIDEIHFLDDPDRGTVWEELLIYLPEDIQILGLSATLSNLEEFANWLSTTRDQEVAIVYEPRRAVPLQFFMCNRDVNLLPVDKFDKRYRLWRRENPRGRRKRSRNRGQGGRESRRDQTRHIHVIESLHRGAFPALYFIFSRALVERLAFDLTMTRTGKRLVDDDTRKTIEARLHTFHQDNPEVLTGKLERMYRQGIAFHHAGLHVSLKGLVEELYEAGLVRVLYCTSTFALGINMPARTVIFDALTKYNGTAVVPLTVREFMQMAGRAGRRGIDTEGDIIIRQDFHDYDDVQPVITKLLEGESEPVNSSFNLSFHAVVNLLDRFPQETIERLLEQSFKAYRSHENARDLRDKISARQSLLDTQAPASEDDDGKRSSRLRKHRKKLASLRRRLVEEERPQLWEEFERKISFLRNYGYLGPQNELLAPALILKKIKIEEIFMTEMILAGVLEDLTPQELFGVMCGLVQTLPRSARVSSPPSKWREIVEPLFEIYDSEILATSKELSQHTPVFTPELMPLGERWARGDSLADLLAEIDNPTDLSGDLVGAMRRAKDMIGQLRYVYYEDEALRRDLAQLMRDVSRDEVQVLG